MELMAALTLLPGVLALRMLLPILVAMLAWSLRYLRGVGERRSRSGVE